jgi:hypothetical protein
MRAAVLLAVLAISAGQAVAARDTVYTCNFKPTARDYLMPATVTITDPGQSGRPVVWDEVVEKEVGHPVVAELKVNQRRSSYAWELVPMDTSRLQRGNYYTSSRVFYSISIGSDHRATLMQSSYGGGTSANRQLFGACSVQR